MFKDYWWGTAKKPSPRMIAEAFAVKDLFDTDAMKTINPGVSWDQPFQVETLERTFDYKNPDEPFWLIKFRMHESNRNPIQTGKIVFTIKITYKPGFPEIDPWVTIPSHEAEILQMDTPHRYNNNRTRICLHGHYSDRNTEWDPAVSTAGTLGLWTIQWIRAMFKWIKNGKENWPGANS